MCGGDVVFVVGIYELVFFYRRARIPMLDCLLTLLLLPRNPLLACLLTCLLALLLRTRNRMLACECGSGEFACASRIAMHRRHGILSPIAGKHHGACGRLGAHAAPALCACLAPIAAPVPAPQARDRCLPGVWCPGMVPRSAPTGRRAVPGFASGMLIFLPSLSD